MSWNGSPNSQEQYRALDLRLSFLLSLLSRIAIPSLLPALSLARKVLLQEQYALLLFGSAPLFVSTESQSQPRPQVFFPAPELRVHVAARRADARRALPMVSRNFGAVLARW